MISVCVFVVLLVLFLQFCKRQQYYRLWFDAAFCKLETPPKTSSGSDDKRKIRRYIFVPFDAWEYEGCDHLWAGIVSNLAAAVEDEFGAIPTRLFRLFYEKLEYYDTVETDQGKSATRHWKTTCNVPNVLCWVIVFLGAVAVVVFAIVTSVMNVSISSNVTITTAIISITALVSVPTVTVIWAYVKSQGSRIQAALKGVEKDLEAHLGVMHQIKTEVECITELLRVVEVLYDQHYKVIITIDDLDRISSKKVKKILNAVNILLSDDPSPFVCLLAVDTKVVLKAVDEAMASNKTKSNISGLEFLRKIITVPFYLPKVSKNDQKGYLDRLLSVNYTEPDIRSNMNEDDNEKIKQFSTDCRDKLSEHYDILKYVDSNPRHMKRIANVLLLSIEMIRVRMKTDKTVLDKISDVRSLVYWVILTDQWPYRMTYLLELLRLIKIEQREPEKEISDIYSHHHAEEWIKKCCPKGEDMIVDAVDGPANFFRELLEKSELTVKTSLSLADFTTNLDYSLVYWMLQHKESVTSDQPPPAPMQQRSRNEDSG